MDAKSLSAIAKQVYRRFPELSGVRPKVRLQPEQAPRSTAAQRTYLITFRGEARAADGRAIPRIVRVVATEQGRILKFSTSR